MQRINIAFMEGYRAAIRMLIEQAEGMAKDKKAKVIAKNTIQWLKLCHSRRNCKHRQMMAKLTETDKQRLEKAKKMYAIIAPHRMDHQNECPSDVQLVLMINRWINPWHACQDLEKIIPFKEQQKIKEKIQ